MSKIIVYADYVFPFCLLGEHVIADVIGDRDIQIAWRPFELFTLDFTPLARPCGDPILTKGYLVLKRSTLYLLPRRSA